MTGRTSLVEELMPVSDIGLGGRKKAGKILGLLGRRRAKKRVGKRNRVEVVHFRIFCQSRIDEEDDRHVDLLMGIEAFVVKAETLDLRKIGSARRRRDIVGRMPDDGLTAEILSGEVCKLLLAEVHFHFALSRFEPPRQRRGDIAIEPHRDGAPESASARCVVPPYPVAAQNNRYAVGEYATRPIMTPRMAMHDAKSCRFLGP
jgi:hypothetical protein